MNHTNILTLLKTPFRCNGKRVLNEHLNEPTCFGSTSRELYASWTSLLGIQAAPLGPLDRQHFSLHLSSLPFLFPVLPSIHHKVSPNCLLLLQVENVIWGWWMECQNCELKQRQFYCENCLRQQSVSSIGTFSILSLILSQNTLRFSLLSYRLQAQHASADRDAHIASAEKSLSTIIEPARLRRAELKGREESVQEIWDGVNSLRSTNDSREYAV